MGGTGLVAVYIKWPNTLKDTLCYICKDRQGSITALVRQDKSVAEKFSYDAWGRRRNPANWADFNVKTPRLISRGYTGHEMIDAFGLINMNGRMYDPAIGRVLSPDNYVQDPTNTQCYNRYSYCMNNPLRFTDPSGWLALANVDNALFNISNAWANRVNNPDSYLYTSGYMGGGGGGGGGWGGNGGVVPGGIHWMPRDIKIDDLASLYDATPSNGKLYTYSNVNGDWYNEFTSTFSLIIDIEKSNNSSESPLLACNGNLPDWYYFVNRANFQFKPLSTKGRYLVTLGYKGVSLGLKNDATIDVSGKYLILTGNVSYDFMNDKYSGNVDLVDPFSKNQSDHDIWITIPGTVTTSLNVTQSSYGWADLAKYMDLLSASFIYYMMHPQEMYKQNIDVY